MYQKPKVERFGTFHELSRGAAEIEPEERLHPFPSMVLRDVRETLKQDDTVTPDRPN